MEAREILSARRRRGHFPRPGARGQEVRARKAIPGLGYIYRKGPSVGWARIVNGAESRNRRESAPRQIRSFKDLSRPRRHGSARNIERAAPPRALSPAWSARAGSPSAEGDSGSRLYLPQGPVRRTGPNCQWGREPESKGSSGAISSDSMRTNGARRQDVRDRRVIPGLGQETPSRSLGLPRCKDEEPHRIRAYARCDGLQGRCLEFAL